MLIDSLEISLRQYPLRPKATRHPALKASYKELRAKGKPPKVALVAIARRLLVILNAKLKEHYAAATTSA
jgi:hypothetical protein